MIYKQDFRSALVALRGYCQYYGISGNASALVRYAQGVRRLVYQALARHSQHSPGLWKRFTQYLQRFPFPRPRIIHRWYATTPTR